MKRIVLTGPPTSNLIYRVGRNRLYLTREGKSWKEMVGWRCIEQLGADNEPFKGQVEVDIKFVGTRLDFDNSLKLLMDAMQGHIYKNDRQVTKATIEMIRTPNTVYEDGSVIVHAWERGKEIIWSSQERR